jgi:DNA-binding transcriptional LysR family regulator
MDFKLFRNFLVVAEEMHVGRAAERIGLAQPALSQQIKTLEGRLGVRLFVRANRGIQLSEAGEAFRREAQRALDHADEAVRAAQRTARGELGRVMIGYVSSAMLDPIFPGVLAEFRAGSPEVFIELHQRTLAEHLDALREQALDLAVLRGPLPSMPEGFDTFAFVRQRVIMALPQGHPATSVSAVALANLAQETFLLLEDPRGTGFADTVEELCAAAGFRPRRSLVVNEVSTIVGLVAAGLGLALVPASAALMHMPGVAYRPLMDVEGYSELMVAHRRFERSAAVRALLGIFRARCLPDGPSVQSFPL